MKANAIIQSLSCLLLVAKSLGNSINASILGAAIDQVLGHFQPVHYVTVHSVDPSLRTRALKAWSQVPFAREHSIYLSLETKNASHKSDVTFVLSADCVQGLDFIADEGNAALFHNATRVVVVELEDACFTRTVTNHLRQYLKNEFSEPFKFWYLSPNSGGVYHVNAGAYWNELTEPVVYDFGKIPWTHYQRAGRCCSDLALILR